MNQPTPNLDENTKQSYQALPVENIAMLSLYPSLDDSICVWMVEIGFVRHYSNEDDLKAAIDSGVVDFGHFREADKLWIGYRYVGADTPYGSPYITLSISRDTPGKAMLKLFKDSRDDHRPPIRSGTVALDDFTKEGCDLISKSPSDHERELGRSLSQVLYDFQLGQGRFGPATKSN